MVEIVSTEEENNRKQSNAPKSIRAQVVEERLKAIRGNAKNDIAKLLTEKGDIRKKVKEHQRSLEQLKKQDDEVEKKISEVENDLATDLEHETKA